MIIDAPVNTKILVFIHVSFNVLNKVLWHYAYFIFDVVTIMYLTMVSSG